MSWTDLGVFAAFEEWGDSHEADIVVPHDCVVLVVVWHLKGVLEYCLGVSEADDTF